MAGNHGWRAAKRAGALALVAAGVAALTAHAAGRPDLVVTKLTAPAGAVQPGVRHNARAVVSNLGSSTVRRSVAGFYLSSGARRGSGDVRLGRASIAAVAPGRRTRVSLQFVVPPSTPSGTYRLLVCAANKCLASRSPMSVRRASAQAGTAPVPVTAGPSSSSPPPAGAPAPGPAPSVQGVPPAAPAAVSLGLPAAGSYAKTSTPSFAGSANTSSFVNVDVYGGTSAAGSPVETVQALPATGGSWSVQASPALPDGSYTARAEATGTLGDTALSDPHTFVVDTRAPLVSVTLNPVSPNGSGGSYATMPGVHVTADDANFQGLSCTVDGAAATIAPTSGSTHAAEGDLTVSGNGTHTVVCTATDRAGWSTSATRTFTVRSVAPAVSLVAPADGSATNDTTPAFTGAAGTAAGDSASVSLKIYAGSATRGSPVQTLTATPSGGAWSATAAALPQGVYTAQASQANSMGDVGYSGANTFTVDTTNPAVTLVHPAAGPTNDPTPAFDGAAGTAAGDSSSVIVKIYSGTAASGTALQTLAVTASGGSWSAAPSTALVDGAYTAQAEQTDSAGNTGRSAARTFTVDTTGPAVTLVHPAAGLTNDATPTFDGAAGTASGDSSTVTVKLYAGSSTTGTPVQTLTAGASSGSWSSSPASVLADGTYTAQAEQTDAAGNTGKSAAQTVSIDATSPSVTLTTPADGAVSTDNTPSFAGGTGTAAGDSTTVTVRVYGGTSATGTPVRTLTATASGGSWGVTPSTSLADGTYTAAAEQSDSAGNTGSSAAHTFSVDTSPGPTVTLAHPATGSTTIDQYPAFDGSAGTAAGDSTSVVVNVYSGTSATGTPVQSLNATRGSTGAWSVQPPNALPVGTYTAQAQQSDAQNHVGYSLAATFSTPAVLLAAGDIASCDADQTGDTATASLLASTSSDAIAALGDNAYPDGTAAQYASCFGPTWGAFKSKIYPAAGNHDYYGSTSATGYFGYFGAAAGTSGQGWYSYDLGTWHVVVLNTNDACTYVSCALGSAQEKWLKGDLAAHPSQCTLAYWHHPLFSSGANGGYTAVRQFWNDLYAAGADVVLNGHDHDYERFAPQDPAAAPDSAHGIREFVAGTGGYTEYEFGSYLEPNSEVHNAATHGLLQLTLRPGGYSWTFLPEAGKTFTDSGTGTCH